MGQFDKLRRAYKKTYEKDPVKQEPYQGDLSKTYLHYYTNQKPYETVFKSNDTTQIGLSAEQIKHIESAREEILLQMREGFDFYVVALKAEGKTNYTSEEIKTVHMRDKIKIIADSDVLTVEENKEKFMIFLSLARNQEDIFNRIITFNPKESSWMIKKTFVKNPDGVLLLLKELLETRISLHKKHLSKISKDGYVSHVAQIEYLERTLNTIKKFIDDIKSGFLISTQNAIAQEFLQTLGGYE